MSRDADLGCILSLVRDWTGRAKAAGRHLKAIWDRPVASRAVCLVVGFAAAAVIFGWLLKFRFRYKPNWGDMPTWLAFITAALVGVVALAQLRGQQKQIHEDAASNRERDKLVVTQLEDASRRENARWREQAEQITVIPFAIRMLPGGTPVGVCEVRNDSRRPVRDVSFLLQLGDEFFKPSQYRFAAFKDWDSQGEHMPDGEMAYVPGESEPFYLGSGFCDRLLAGSVITVTFEADGAQPGRLPLYLVRFTDNAYQFWDLDSDMDLEIADGNFFD